MKSSRLLRSQSSSHINVNAGSRKRKTQSQQAIAVAGTAAGVLIVGKILSRLFSLWTPSEDLPGLKFHANLGPAEILKLVDDVIQKSRRIHDQIAAVPLNKVSYANVIAPLAKLEAEQSALVQSCKLPRIVSTSNEIREASFEAEKKLDAFEVKCSMREDVYRAVKAFAEKKEPLNVEAQRYVDSLMRDYKRSGLNLDAETRHEVERLKTRIGELCIVFLNNVNEDKSTILFSEEELAGIPLDTIKSLDIGESGKLKVTPKPPHYSLIMEHCKVRSTRRAMSIARDQRCTKENVPILEKVLELRCQLARLLGYKNWGEYALEVCMAESPEKVKAFHELMLSHVKTAAEKQLEKLRSLKEEEDGDRSIGVEDIRYYILKAEEREFKLNDAEIRQYFPVETVTSGLMNIYQELLGLSFKEVKKFPSWHPDVRLFAVHDTKSSVLLGYTYLDLYAREGKFTNSCVSLLQPGCNLGNGKWQVPAATLLLSFSKPSKEKPVMLSHSEVVLFFHEFCHLMHHICSRVQFAKFSSFRVEMDFLEAPSQMLENWCYEKTSLAMMSQCTNRDNRDPERVLPSEIFNILEKRRKSFFALRVLRNQIFLGLFDQLVHSEEKINTEQILKKLHMEVVLGIPLLEGTNLSASLLHLMMGGYDGVCYGYLWSEVLAADMFESKFKGKLLDSEAGLEFRNKVLAPGASKDAKDILKEFLGHEPMIGPFLRLKGIAAERG